jgi:hypothetical protein
MTMLAVALPWTTALSINLRCATPLLPIAIDRPSPPLHRPLPNEAVNAPQQQTASAEIPIASDAPLRHISRGFLPWRFADAGPAARGAVTMGRHPKGDVAASFDPLVGKRIAATLLLPDASLPQPVDKVVELPTKLRIT